MRSRIFWPTFAEHPADRRISKSSPPVSATVSAARSASDVAMANARRPHARIPSSRVSQGLPRMALAIPISLRNPLPPSEDRQNRAIPRPRSLDATPVQRRRAQGPALQTRHLPHPSTQLRHTPPRKRYRHPNRPRPARSYRRLHHHDLPPRHETPRNRWPQPACDRRNLFSRQSMFFLLRCAWRVKSRHETPWTKSALRRGICRTYAARGSIILFAIRKKIACFPIEYD